MLQYYTFSDHFIRVKNIELNDCTHRTANDQCWYDVLVNFKVYTLQIEHRRSQGHRSGRPYNFSTTVRWEYDPLTDTELINNLFPQNASLLCTQLFPRSYKSSSGNVD